MVPSVPVPEGKYEFLVILPDKPGMHDRRLEVRRTHFDGAAIFRENGIWKTGGGLLTSVPEDDQPENLDFYGSAFVVVAGSVDEAREQFSNDVYATSGVWDMDKLQIYPFRAGFRDP